MKRLILITTISIFFLRPSHSNAEGVVFAGIPIIIDESAKQWGPGYRFGISCLHPLSSQFRIGGQFSFNYWGIGGSLFALEIYPSVRLNEIFREFENIDFFAQFGAGYTIIHSGISDNGFHPACASCSTVDGASNLWDLRGFGLNMGLGLRTKLAGKANIEIVPMVHLGFANDDVNAFVSANFGVILGTQ